MKTMRRDYAQQYETPEMADSPRCISGRLRYLEFGLLNGMVLLALGLFLSACGQATKAPKISGNEQTNYAVVGIGTSIRGAVTYQFDTLAWLDIKEIESRDFMDWDVPGSVAQISRQILEQAGASVVFTKSEPFTDAFEAADVDVGVVFRNASYTSAPAEKSGFWVRTNDPGKLVHVHNFCRVAIQPFLVDIRAKTVQPWHTYAGQAKLPFKTSAQTWSALSATEKSQVIQTCRSALSQAVAGALKGAGIIE